jgi:hypothetical protein
MLYRYFTILYIFIFKHLFLFNYLFCPTLRFESSAQRDDCCTVCRSSFNVSVSLRKGRTFLLTARRINTKSRSRLRNRKKLTIIPLEVKAGKTGSIKLLIQFAKEKKSKVAINIGTQPPMERSVSIDSSTLNVLYLPIYLADKI